MRGLPKSVLISLEKARDSALLAVEVYNKPAVKFKSGAFITLMIKHGHHCFMQSFSKEKLSHITKIQTEDLKKEKEILITGI